MRNHSENPRFGHRDERTFNFESTALSMPDKKRVFLQARYAEGDS